MEKNKSKIQKFGEIVTIVFVILGVLLVALELGSNVSSEVFGVYEASTSNITGPLPLATISTESPMNSNPTPLPEIVPTIDLENFNVEN